MSAIDDSLHTTKKLNSIFDHIYIIHLPQSKERENHIQQQFEKILGLQKEEYEIFEGSSRTSQKVKELMMSPMVKKFPPCFRCGKNNCQCENNIFTYSQIGNWHSFRSVWENMIKNEYNFCMICEDDVKFHSNFVSLITTFLSEESFRKHNLNKHNPVLILLNTTNPKQCVPHYKYAPNMSLSEGSMSNACYALNLPMARLLLQESSKKNGIKHTSDVFTHSKIPQHFREVQKRIILPVPSTQLSIEGQMTSCVRPKGFIRKVKFVNGKSNMFYINQLDKI